MRPEIIRVNALEPEPSLVSYVADRIRHGSVVGMPTDTFYGLAVDPYNLHAVERVYEIKERGRHKPLSLLIESVDQAEELAHNLPDEFHLLAEKFWPGPLTLVVRRRVDRRFSHRASSSRRRCMPRSCSRHATTSRRMAFPRCSSGSREASIRVERAGGSRG